VAYDPKIVMKMKKALALVLAILPLALCLAAMQSLSDADPAQSGYLPNHNIDPAEVGSPAFKVLWQKSFNAKEVVSIRKNFSKLG
jgi:iron transport multicopper oxidase